MPVSAGTASAAVVIPQLLDISAVARMGMEATHIFTMAARVIKVLIYWSHNHLLYANYIRASTFRLRHDLSVPIMVHRDPSFLV